MATALLAVPICCRCQSPPQDALVQLASRGELLSVCERCFLLDQLGQLTAGLPAGDATRDLVDEGLRALYEVVVSRSQDLAVASFRDASESRR